MCRDCLDSMTRFTSGSSCYHFPPMEELPPDAQGELEAADSEDWEIIGEGPFIARTTVVTVNLKRLRYDGEKGVQRKVRVTVLQLCMQFKSMLFGTG